METAPEKPAFGSPCNGCGFCCAAEQCEISLQVFGDVGAPCPAMQFEDGRFHCGVLRDAPPVVQPLIAYVLGIGRGCDADDPETSTPESTESLK